MALARSASVVVSSTISHQKHHGSEDSAHDPAMGTGDVEKGVKNKPSLLVSDSESALSVGKQLELEANNAIKYRTCSWPKVNHPHHHLTSGYYPWTVSTHTAALLFSEYICLAIMSFPSSYSLLGLVPGLILTAVVAAFVLYTSLILWKFCLRHPQVRDVCDIGQMLFWGKSWAWYATAVMFLLNNTFIQALHVLVGAKYLNTMTNHSTCTITFGIITTFICFVVSLPRTFSALAKIATASAFFTFVSVLLAAIFAGIGPHPLGYNSGIKGMTGEPIVRAFNTSSTFIQGMSAFLNISYTFIGQITLPSFIAEMREPRDFPKALWAVTIAEIIVFSLVGAIVYNYVGEQYMTSPAFGSIGNENLRWIKT
ncbi:MAG: hypothetical protein M1823_005465 [Watsoniomyces obsoletus]|nr:MAG: hypothetical protein M1823_005465 [Watsoniomyces obsoletus]